MLNYIKYFFFLLLIYVSLLFLFTDKAEAAILFQDNFDSGTAEQWTPTSGPNLWQVNNKKYGALINNGSTIIQSNAGSIPTARYTIEFDILPVQGTDKNIDFRWRSNVNNYGIHFNNDNGGTVQFGKAGSSQSGWPKIKNYLMSNGQSHHIKIVLDNQHIKFSVDNNILFDEIDTDYQFTVPEQLGLRISTGADFPTEVYFDNIVVSSIDDDLNVPYFNQNSLPWGPIEYDSAISLGIPSPTMNRWGCAVTSAAMVLNYFNIKNLADGTPIDPGSLNTWLKNNNGFVTGTGTDGSYSYILWPQVAKLTKDLFDSGKSPVALAYDRKYDASSSPQIIKDDLTVRKIPDILYVHNASTSGHFVVAKGVGNNTFHINDPEWNVPDLSSFQRYDQIDRYIPTQTNLSYLLVVTNPSVEIAVTDPNGKKTGKIIQNGNTNSFNQIASASYAFETPISNPNLQNILQRFGTGINVFLLPIPQNGNYTVQLSSNSPKSYTANVVTFDKNGKSFINTITGTSGPNSSDTIKVAYSQTTPSQTTKIVTFQQMIDDTNELLNLHEIFYSSVAQSIAAKLSDAKQDAARGQKTIALRKLDSLKVSLTNLKGKGMSDFAFQILSNDLTLLRSSL